MAEHSIAGKSCRKLVGVGSSELRAKPKSIPQSGPKCQFHSMPKPSPGLTFHRGRIPSCEFYRLPSVESGHHSDANIGRWWGCSRGVAGDAAATTGCVGNWNMLTHLIECQKVSLRQVCTSNRGLTVMVCRRSRWVLVGVVN